MRGGIYDHRYIACVCACAMSVMYCNQVALLHNVIIISEVNEKFILIINIVLSLLLLLCYSSFTFRFVITLRSFKKALLYRNEAIVCTISFSFCTLAIQEEVYLCKELINNFSREIFSFPFARCCLLINVTNEYGI